MIRTASACHSKDGYLLDVRDVPLRVLIMQDLIFRLHLPDLFIMAPEWFYSIGWGRDDEWEWKTHSLGHACHWAFQRLTGYGFRKEKRLHMIPLTIAEVAEHFPDQRIEWLEHDEGCRCTDG